MYTQKEHKLNWIEDVSNLESKRLALVTTEKRSVPGTWTGQSSASCAADPTV